MLPGRDGEGDQPRRVFGGDGYARAVDPRRPAGEVEAQVAGGERLRRIDGQRHAAAGVDHVAQRRPGGQGGGVEALGRAPGGVVGLQRRAGRPFLHRAREVAALRVHPHQPRRPLIGVDGQDGGERFLGAIAGVEVGDGFKEEERNGNREADRRPPTAEEGSRGQVPGARGEGSFPGTWPLAPGTSSVGHRRSAVGKPHPRQKRHRQRRPADEAPGELHEVDQRQRFPYWPRDGQGHEEVDDRPGQHQPDVEPLLPRPAVCPANPYQPRRPQHGQQQRRPAQPQAQRRVEQRRVFGRDRGEDFAHRGEVVAPVVVACCRRHLQCHLIHLQHRTAGVEEGQAEAEREHYGCSQKGRGAGEQGSRGEGISPAPLLPCPSALRPKRHANQIDPQRRRKDQRRDVVAKRQQSQAQRPSQEGAEGTEQHPAPPDPQQERQQRQRQRLRRIAAHQGIDEHVGRGHVGHGRDDARPRPEQIAHPQAHEDATSQDSQGVEQVRRRRQRQPGQVGQQDGVERRGLAIDEEGIAVAEGQIGQPARQVDAVAPGVGHGGHAMVVQVAVVGAGHGRPAQQGGDEGQAEGGDQ